MLLAAEEEVGAGGAAAGLLDLGDDIANVVSVALLEHVEDDSHEKGHENELGAEFEDERNEGGIAV